MAIATAVGAFISDERGGTGSAVAVALGAIALGFAWARWRYGWDVATTWQHVSDAAHRMSVGYAASSDL